MLQEPVCNPVGKRIKLTVGKCSPAVHVCDGRIISVIPCMLCEFFYQIHVQIP